MLFQDFSWLKKKVCRVCWWITSVRGLRGYYVADFYWNTPNWYSSYKLLKFRKGFRRVSFVTDVSTTAFGHATELRAWQLQKVHLHHGRFLVPFGLKWYACQILSVLGLPIYKVLARMWSIRAVLADILLNIFCTRLKITIVWDWKILPHGIVHLLSRAVIS